MSLARLLPANERTRAESLLSSDGPLRKAFENYESKNNSLDSIVNVGFGAFTRESASNFKNICDKMLADRIGEGVTLREMLLLSREHGLEPFRGGTPQEVTLQITSINHELRDGEFVYRRYKLLRS